MDFEPGIYFGLPEDTYHAIPALSNSGIRNLLISPMDFWARTSWLNPNYEPETSDAMAKGSAYHRRILEGSAAFYQTYAPELQLADYPDALVKTDQIRAWLRDRGLKVGGNKPDLIARALEAEPDLMIWDEMKDRHRLKAHVKGQQIIPADWIDEIEISAAHIEKHAQLSKAFTGGHPEVTILWEADGVPMKARLDYLKPKAVVDLKTFSNPLGKPVDRAITTAMAGGRYHIQAYVYLEAVEAAKNYWRERKINTDTAELLEAYTKAQNTLNALLESDQTFLFVFQQTGIAPIARGKVFPKGLVYDCGKAAVTDARKVFAEHMEQFGTDPWIDQAPIETFADDDFPIYMTEV